MSSVPYVTSSVFCEEHLLHNLFSFLSHELNGSRHLMQGWIRGSYIDIVYFNLCPIQLGWPKQESTNLVASLTAPGSGVLADI